MTSISANLPHRHVDHETGHILHLDPLTGEIIIRKEMIYYKDERARYEAWAAERRAEDLTAEYDTVQANLANIQFHPQSAVPQVLPRGRPKTVFQNPVAMLMPFFTVPDLATWVDDIVRGSISTSAGTTNGKTNVRTRAVTNALFLSEITAEACKTGEVSLRTAQRIAKAARHAAYGIATYVERHSGLWAELVAEIGETALFRTFQR
ncbi:hypothetical protein SB14R_22715 [Pseudomonas oryzihabitans]|nr:hypothetical protein SB14R_22715 [Pseudomonas psychrotolerans]